MQDLADNYPSVAELASFAYADADYVVGTDFAGMTGITEDQVITALD